MPFTMEARAEGKVEPELWISVSEIGAEETPGVRGLQLTSVAPTKSAARVTEDMLNGVSDTLKRVCQMVSGAFQAANRPDELVVKFELKVGAKGGTNVFLLTEATDEGTLAIEAKWTNPKPTPGVPQ